jgi:myo-inositol-1(or 4)-monophosphatase
MTLVANGLGDGTVDLYVGDQFAASDEALLRKHNVTMVLNCAVNLDINYVDQTIDKEPEAKRRAFCPHPHMRVAKVGLIDGPGNHPALLAAACQVIHGMLTQQVPVKTSYPQWKPGNLLVHCRGGRSRSITVSSIYLHRAFPDRWPAWEDALLHVQQQRGIEPDELATAPNAGMRALAKQALTMLELSQDLLPRRR